MRTESAPTCWLADVDSESFAPPLTLPAATEAVIVGGGLMGIATAYWLARFGVDVLLLEARQLGWGASGRNAGMMLAGATPLEDPSLVRQVMQDEGIAADYAQPGHLALASSPDVWDKVRDEAARRLNSARPIYALDHPACEDLLGMRVNRRFLGGRWFPHGGVIHPARFVYGLAASARKHGAVLATHTHALDVRPSVGRDGFDLHTSRGDVRTRLIIFACCAGIAEFLPELREVITLVRGQVMCTQPLPPLFKMGLAVDWGSVYWRQNSAGAVVIGGRRNLDPLGETGPEEQVHDLIQDALSRFLPDTFPDFPPFHVDQRWAGIMDFTTDDRPIVGTLPHRPNQWVIAGFGGHGMPAGLGVGRAVAQAISTGSLPDVLASYCPDRFRVPIGR